MDERNKGFEKEIAHGRAFMRSDFAYSDDGGWESDQYKKLPQPPLFKLPMGGERTVLTRDFSGLDIKNDYLACVDGRESRRRYSEKGITLKELSFLLWCTQGVKKTIENGYCAMRTVPCGGCRHEFECYFIANKVEGLKQGLYHYLPDEHAVEYLRPVENAAEVISKSVYDQRWAARSDVMFYYTMVAYRAEWRYGIYAHRVALIDLGHIGQAMYMACEALGLGTCGIGAYDPDVCDPMIGVDGSEEYTVYAQPVGRWSAGNQRDV